MAAATLIQQQHTTARPTGLCAADAERLFAESGIAPEVAEARGYYTETDPGRLAGLGFAEYQRRVPSLAIPEWGVDGLPRGAKLRPHCARRDAEGKIIKYEAAAGRPLTLDVPPLARPMLSNRAHALIITEGSRKADSAVSRGLCAISVPGVYGWLRGGQPLPDFDRIPLRGRLVIPAFDSDTATNPKVSEARSRLTAELRSRGAIVAVVDLPPGPDGAKSGLDDFFASGHSVDDFMARLRPAPADPAEDTDRERRLTEENAALKRDLAKARQHNAALVGAVCNPHLRPNERVLAVRIASELQYQLSRGETADGRYRHSVTRLAGDFRGEAGKASTPQDGSPPIMTKATAIAAMKRLEAAGLIDTEPRRARQAVTKPHPETGKPIPVTVEVREKWALWLGDPTAFLRRVAAYQPITPRTRKRSCTPAPCPHCGEVHRKVSYCEGCGSRLSVSTAPAVAEPRPPTEGAAWGDKTFTPKPDGVRRVPPSPPPDVTTGEDFLTSKTAPPSSTIAAAFLRGDPMPLTISRRAPAPVPTAGPAPPDRYTDMARLGGQP